MSEVQSRESCPQGQVSLLHRLMPKGLPALLLGGLASAGFGVSLALYSRSPVPMLLIAALISLLVFVATDLALYGMLLCWPFSFRYILPSQFELQMPTEPLLGMLLFAFAMKLLLDKVQGTDRTRSFPFTWPLLGYIVSLFLPSVIAPSLIGAVKGATRAASYMALAWVVHDTIRTRFQLRTLFAMSFPPAAVAVIWTVIVLIQHIDRWQWTSAYEGAPFPNYSAYGGFVAVFLLILVSRLFFDRSRYDRVLWTFFLGIFSVGMLFCFSRGVWLALFVAFGFLFLQQDRGASDRRLLFIGGAVVLLMFVLSIPGVLSAIEYRIMTLFNPHFASNRSRLLRWARAIMMFLHSPIIGNGYGAFAELYEEDARLVGAYTAQFQLGAHSEYLQVLAEQGIVGFGMWIWVIVTFFRYGFRQLKQVEDSFYRSLIVGLLAAELALLVFCLVFTFPDGDELSIPFWLIYGLLPAVGTMAERDRSVQMLPQRLTEELSHE